MNIDRGPENISSRGPENISSGNFKDYVANDYSTNEYSRFVGAYSVDNETLKIKEYSYNNRHDDEIYNSKIRKAKNTRVDFKNAKLSGYSFVNAMLPWAIFVEIEGENINFNKSLLIRADFKFSELTNPTFNESKLESIEFTDSLLINASFKKSDLSKALFNNTTINVIDLSGANLTNADFRNSVIENANFSNANLTGVDFDSALLTGVNFSNANLSNADFSNSTINDIDLSGAIGLETSVGLEYYLNPSNRPVIVNPLQVHQSFNPILKNYKQIMKLLINNNREKECSLTENAHLDPTYSTKFIYDSLKIKDFDNEDRYIYNEINKLIKRIGTNISTKLNDFEGNIYDITFKDLWCASIEFGSRQSLEYRELFITLFLKDCNEAYEGIGETSMSCPKGVLERFILTIPSALAGTNDLKNEDNKNIYRLISGKEYIGDVEDSNLINQHKYEQLRGECFNELTEMDGYDEMDINERKKLFVSCIVAKFENELESEYKSQHKDLTEEIKIKIKREVEDKVKADTSYEHALLGGVNKTKRVNMKNYGTTKKRKNTKKNGSIKNLKPIKKIIKRSVINFYKEKERKRVSKKNKIKKY